MPERGVSPVVAVVCLLLVAVVAAGALGATAVGLADRTSSTAPVHVVVTASATESGRIALTLAAGPTLDVRDLRVRVTVDGVPLDRQPPVPFFAARGFGSGPVGPFNVAADPHWSAGETASVRLAATNAPPLSRGDVVRVRLYYRSQPVGSARATVQRTDQQGGRRSLDGRRYSGTRATVVMAISGLYDGPIVRWRTSSKPAAWNIRSASSSS